MTLSLTSATGGGESAMGADLAMTQQSLSLWRAGWDEDTRVIRRTRGAAVKYAEVMRLRHEPCGLDAKLFEPRR